jgi:hypothetical protein
MRWAVAGVCVLAGAAVAGSAAAKGLRCAMPEEASAIQTAAIQQELMVAALTCNEIARFNSFQTGFGPELRIADATLARLFRRLYGGARGEAEYHSFKTKLANDSSMRSIRNNPAYCQEAAAMFTQALAPVRPALVTFVNGTAVMIERRPVEACGSGTETTRAAEDVTRRKHRRHKG